MRKSDIHAGLVRLYWKCGCDIHEIREFRNIGLSERFVQFVNTAGGSEFRKFVKKTLYNI
ncbi:hypothetical protein CDO73_17120 [Saccharibacillus sp. O23]|nr:hypothetical protein CDO73_17120 [Saccharibacillus sp. O23]